MRGTLKVLLWKHFVVRVRRFIHSPIEIISPAILFIALFSIKDYIIHPRLNYNDEFNVKQTELVVLNSVDGVKTVYYTPETDLTSLLMNKVKESLAYKTKYSQAIEMPEIIPKMNELELQKILKDIREDVAVVIFQNISGTWPEKLKYTIRIKNYFYTYTYRSDGDLGPHEYYGTTYEPFMKLQWAIDSNYLELLTGNKIKQRVTLQEFPYAETNENHMATLFANILKAFCFISLMLVFVFLMARLLEERITGIQELIKMVGVSNNMLGVSHVLNVVPAGLVYSVVATILLTVTSTPIISNTNPLLIFLMLVLHYFTIIALAFCSSYIVNNTQYTETLAVLVYIALCIPARLLEGRNLPRWTLPLCGLLPHVPMHWFWDEVAALQQYGNYHHGGLLPHVPMHWFWDEVAALQQYGNYHHGGLLPHVPMHWFWDEVAALQQYGNYHHGGLLPHVPMHWFWDEVAALQQYGNYHHGGLLPHVPMHWFWDEVAALQQYGNYHHGGLLPPCPCTGSGTRWPLCSSTVTITTAGCCPTCPCTGSGTRWPLCSSTVTVTTAGRCPRRVSTEILKCMGLSINDIVSSHNAANGSVLTCYLCLILQSCILFGVAAYLAKVRPGPYGQALPWNFLFQKQYWNKKKVTPDGHEELEDLEDIINDPEYFEPPPNDMEVGIKIVNVSKVFEKHRALSEVTLDVYKGEITVLLGHNGAGKTTLMSIITGMLKATEGNVYVEGLDTVTQKDEMQRILGLCPQHNLFFPDLTVLEHVMFFTLLKGASYTEAKESSQALLQQLGLDDRSSYKSSELSGGMKRRLQLACALAGDAKVLVLDEPTSGLDVETRRGLWDLLLSLRGSRTVLLSTHFMEEAEALGDRVAALHAGRLRCHATTMHLKRALGECHGDGTVL
ncbi:unnamed protein product [Euphydryas editha]|uniref:ABC transporter domain-containing protein n=1 Tax=Euphydryas editha TaxID=104508 RepID=A0AAU9TWA2_EUPED|nr:unnamed protein product [Euphydryas editha]